MSSLKKITLFLLSLSFFFLSFGKRVEAAVSCPLTTDPPSPIVGPTTSIRLSFDTTNIIGELKNYPPGGTLKYSYPSILCKKKEISDSSNPLSYPPLKNSISDTVYNDNSLLTTCDVYLFGAGEKQIDIVYEYGDTAVTLCSANYTIEGTNPDCEVHAEYSGQGNVTDNTWEIVVSDVQMSSPYNAVGIEIDEEETLMEFFLPPYSKKRTTKTLPLSVRKKGTHKIIVYSYVISDSSRKGPQMCSASFQIAKAGETPVPPTPTPTLSQTCAACILLSPPDNCSGDCYECPGCPGEGITQIPKLKPLCEQLHPDFQKACKNCINDTSSGGHIWTAIGCLPADYSALVKDYIFTLGTGIAGGVAFLYFLYGAFLVLTSTGDPKKLEEAKQIIISALSGLLLIIFSIFLLKVIGVDILKLPGFE